MIYFKKDTALPPFIPLPRFMIASEHSINAKLLYGLLLNRTMLSQKSGWVSEDGNVYVIYTIKQMADDLNRSERTVKTALNELENAGLITRVRQGWNRANRIFLHLPDGVQLSSPPEGNICPMEVQETSPCMGQKLPTSNTKQEYINMIQTERGEIARRRFGEYQNVFLSDDEFTRLQNAYPDKYEEYSIVCRLIWKQAESITLTTMPRSESGSMRTASRNPEIAMITITPTIKESAYEN